MKEKLLINCGAHGRNAVNLFVRTENGNSKINVSLKISVELLFNYTITRTHTLTHTHISHTI